MNASGLRQPPHGALGSAAGGFALRGGLPGGSGAAGGEDARHPHQWQPPPQTLLPPDGLPSKGVIEPLGSLAYQQLRSAFAFSPSFEVPLPSLSLPPRLAAYPLRKSRICGQGNEGTTVPTAVDAAAAQQLLTPFDAAGLLPSLVNPLGYPRLLLDPPMLAGCGGLSAAAAHKQHQQLQKRPFPSEDALRTQLESLHKDDLALVIDNLPEVPDNLRRSLRQKAFAAPAEAAPGATATTGDVGAADPSAQQQRQARQQHQQHAQLRHPSKPHLTVRRVMRVVPHPTAAGVRLVHVSFDVPAAESKTLKLPPSSHASEKTEQEQQTQQEQQQASSSWALLLPSGGSGAEATTYAFYLRDLQKEAADAATRGGTQQVNQRAFSYCFRRDYVWQPSASGGAAGAERAVVLVVPPSSPAKPGDNGEAQREEECMLLQLAGPRRVLLKAGASKRRPRVLGFLGGKEQRQMGDDGSQHAGRDESPRGSPACRGGEGAPTREGRSNDEDDSRTGAEVSAGEEGEADEPSGRQRGEDGLFTEDVPEEEEEATSGSGSSGSEDGSSSESSQENDD